MTGLSLRRLAAAAAIQYAVTVPLFSGVLLSRVPAGVSDRFAKDPSLYLPWLAQIADTFLWAHVMIVFSAAIFMVVPFALYDHLRAVAPAPARLALGFGVLALTLILIYATVDGFGSPMLGRLYATGSETEKAIAAIVWQWMDRWRDEGLKSLTYFFAALWLLVNGSLLRRAGAPFGLRFAWFTLVFGASMALMALANIVLILAHLPLADDGVLGLLNLVLFQTIWAAWLGVILWTARR